MFVGYERRTRAYKRAEPVPYVSINRRGEIVMNFPALRQIMTLDRISLFYERETNRIGISHGDQSHLAVPVLHIFEGRPRGRGGRLRVFRVRRFLKHFGITITETLVFRNVKKTDRMLLIDLGPAQVSEARM